MKQIHSSRSKCMRDNVLNAVSTFLHYTVLHKSTIQKTLNKSVNVFFKFRSVSTLCYPTDDTHSGIPVLAPPGANGNYFSEQYNYQVYFFLFICGLTDTFRDSPQKWVFETTLSLPLRKGHWEQYGAMYVRTRQYHIIGGVGDWLLSMTDGVYSYVTCPDSLKQPNTIILSICPPFGPVEWRKQSNIS